MSAPFSPLGIASGGDGRTSCGLPDPRGRAAIGFGTHVLGRRGGLEGVTLNSMQLPSHTYSVNLSGSTLPGDAYLPGSTEPGSVTDPDGAYLGATGGRFGPMPGVFQTQPGRWGRSPYQAVNYQFCMIG